MCVLCGALAGACLGFLWFNRHPARVFMGDTGSLPIGAGLAVAALVARLEVVLALVGAVFLVDYDQVERGNLGRSPDLVSLDLHADYPLQIGRAQLRFFLDVFNAFQSREPAAFVDTVELSAGVTNPDFLKPVFYQAPRSWRIGARWDF